MATGQDIVNRIRRHFPDVSETIVLEQLNEVHAELTRDIPLNRSSSTLTSLVDGTREYSLGATVARVWSAHYATTSAEGLGRTLRPTNIEYLDEHRGEWRNQGDAEPREFYIYAGNIGFYPTPPTTSSGGYPRVTLQVTTYDTIVVGTTMPTFTSSHEAWVMGTCERLALERNDQRLPYFSQKAKLEKALLGDMVRGRNIKDQDLIIPAFARGAQQRV